MVGTVKGVTNFVVRVTHAWAAHGAGTFPKGTQMLVRPLRNVPTPIGTLSRAGPAVLGVQVAKARLNGQGHETLWPSRDARLGRPWCENVPQRYADARTTFAERSHTN